MEACQVENEKIFLGLDIGTDSVGWAVTDGEYKLKKFRNNLMWGSHLFDEANQSADRRSFRTARRRLDRRQQRITLLQEFFAKEVLKKDEYFFMRLKESTLLPEDAEHRTKNIFFDDVDYTDKNYNEEYPTIHHLILELMNNPQPQDVRLVYLACAYLLGHRGHFLNPVEKENINNITDFSQLYDNFITAIEGKCEEVPFDCKSQDFAECLKQKISITNKEKAFYDILFNGKKPKKDDYTIRFDLIVKLICGGTAKLSEIFFKEEYKDLEKDSITVASADFSDTLDLLYNQIDDDEHSIISSIKAMYDWSLLVDILNGHKLISEAKVEIYKQHKSDLTSLKCLCRKYLSSKEYNEIFREDSKNPNYASYVYNISNSSSNYKKCTQEDFCKFIKKYIEKIKPDVSDTEVYNDILDKCTASKLCPKQVTTDNRVIPYQLYYVELKKILDNACKYLDFLNIRDEYGSISEKILKIMGFRIPYYVGPLVSSEKSKNAWLVRKAEGKIYPWNFDDMVNHDKTETEFIIRMTCKCTYLAGEDVLPKNSLLYCKFNVLNEINNITIDGIAISVDVKQKLYNTLFAEKNIKVTKKKIKNYLISIGAADENSEISGIDDNIKSSLKSYHNFKNLMSEGILSENDAEKIIERITVTTDKKRLKKWLRETYKNLPESEITYISKLNYTDYGRLSRRLLEEIYEVDSGTSEIGVNIITRLWETNENLMKLLSAKYGYASSISQHNEKFYSAPENVKNISEKLKEMYIPTAVRRSVSRTLDITSELKKILKNSPDKIFIEMARCDEETKKGKATQSRREQIEALFKSVRDSEDISQLEKRLKDIDVSKLRSEKYYLYFIQLGKCMYTGKAIPFEEIEDNYRWNIDHIWPQAKIKDDSIENKVLVDTNANGAKGDKYPIQKEIREKMNPFWSLLHKNKLIGDKKYSRLTRNHDFDDDELSGFIARQLVETRQSTKAVAELLKSEFPESEIVYVKAGLVSEFRQEMEMMKCREINDLHHAKDAYLNIVIGNVYNVKFTHNPLNFIKNKENYSLKLFKKDQNGKQSGLLTHIVERNGEKAWEPDKSFNTVRKMMSKNSIRFVRYCYQRKCGQNGGFFDQNPLRKGKGMVPIKKGLSIEKYGGYDNATISFFCIANIKGTGAVLASVELLYADKFLSDNDFARQYIAHRLSDDLKTEILPQNLEFPFKNRVIKINTVLELDNYRVMIAAKQNSSIKYVSAESLILDDKYIQYAKKIFSYLQKSENGKKYSIDAYSGISREKNIELFDTLVKKCFSGPFDKMYKELGEKMENEKNAYANYTLEEQAKIITQIIGLFKTGRKTGVDLSAVGGKAHSGIKTLNTLLYKVKDFKSIRIIDQSPTGLFEKKSVNLLEL